MSTIFRSVVLATIATFLVGAYLMTFMVFPADAQNSSPNTADIPALMHEITRLRQELADLKNGTVSGCYSTENVEYCYDGSRTSQSSMKSNVSRTTNTNVERETLRTRYTNGTVRTDLWDRYGSDYYNDSYNDYSYADEYSGYGYVPEYRDEIYTIDASFSLDRAYVWVKYSGGDVENYVYNTENEREVIGELSHDLRTDPRLIADLIDFEYSDDSKSQRSRTAYY